MTRVSRMRLSPGLFILVLAGCSSRGPVRNEYPLGEKVPVGPLTYTVVETAWKTQLGQVLNVRVPQRRFLLVTISVTNGGGRDVSIPLLQLEESNNKTYTESED